MGKTILESSESFPSPGAIHHASVSSQSGPRGELSQVMVTHALGGSGLVAFYQRRVPMGFSWRGDYHLEVSYPDDLQAPTLDARNSSFGYGGKGAMTCHPVRRSDLTPLRWTRTGEVDVVATEQLERGSLLTFESDGRSTYAYTYYDVREPDSSANELRALGLQAGGPTWAGIIQGLVALRAPALARKLDLDPEADGLAVRSTNRATLIRVAKLVAEAKRTPAVLAAAIERARLDNAIE